jgi:hypothetical protein
LSSAPYRLAGFTLMLCALFRADAQQAARADAAITPVATNLQHVPRVPGLNTLWRGLNAGVTFSGVHDSAIGWYTVATPAVSYTLTQHYSADASISIYPSRQVQNTDLATLLTNPFQLEVGDLGDTFIGIHASFNRRLLRNTTTASFTIATGDQSAGLGSGKFTFDFSDHVERSYKRVGFLLDLGAGNSSGLFNRLVTSDYTSVGALTHFQQGVVVWLPGRSYIQSVAYQQVPIGSQTIFTIPAPPGFPSSTLVFGKSSGRDLGVTTFVGIPLSSHVTLSSYYSRSFSQPLDTVSMGLTFVLRGRSGTGRLSMIDRALREAEQGSQLTPGELTR